MSSAPTGRDLVWQDQLLERGFDAINDKDLAEWLRGHGLELEENPLEWPALLRAVYDGCFAFAVATPTSPAWPPGGRCRAPFGACFTTKDQCCTGRRGA